LILVTVGTHNQGFERLIKTVDKLVREKKINEKVIIQTGNTDYIPQNCKWFKFTSIKNFIKICKKSTIIITHGGVGSIIIPLQLKKPTIVVPRLKKFNEHVDDHQLQIAKELEKQRKLIVVYNIKYLENAIKKARNFVPSRIEKKNKILNIIEKFILEVEHEQN
jgi:UDP-N-acetylglucosamine transferase subunit ALG13